MFILQGVFRDFLVNQELHVAFDQKSRVPCVLFPEELGPTNTAFVKIQQQILDRKSCERMEFRLYRMQWEQNPPQILVNVGTVCFHFSRLFQNRCSW